MNNKTNQSISLSPLAQNDVVMSGLQEVPPVIGSQTSPPDFVTIPQFQCHKPRLLWIGDADVPTGFATVTHSILKHLVDDWNILVSGINCRKPSAQYPYPVIPACRKQDMWGIDSFAELCRDFRPDIVVINNDWWNVAEFVKCEVDVPIVAYMPVDGANLDPAVMAPLNQLEAAVWYTDFGWNEARDAGFTGKRHIVPHGSDPALSTEVDKKTARKQLGLNLPEGAFLVGNVNRNQPRKRLDLTLDYFASWIQENQINDAWLCMHCSHSKEGWDLRNLARFHGIENRVVFTNGQGRIGSVTRERLQLIYQSLDLQVTTTSGEGWGLTTMEGMSHGIAQIVPDWAALGEWTGDAVIRIPSTTRLAHPGINTIGALPDRTPFIDALDQLYRNRGELNSAGEAARDLVNRPQFRWQSIARQFHRLLSDSIVTEQSAEDLRRAS